MPFEKTWGVLFQQGFERLAGKRPDSSEQTLATLLLKASRALDSHFDPPDRIASLKRSEETDLGMGEYEVCSETLYGSEARGIRIRRVERRTSDAAGPSLTSLRTDAYALGLSPGIELKCSILDRPEPFFNAGLQITVRGTAQCEWDAREAVHILEAHFSVTLP